MVELKHELRNEGRNMVMNEEIRSLIAAADRAIKEERFDKLSVVITLILAFVFLHEKFTVKSGIGCLLIGAGTLLMVL